METQADDKLKAGFKIQGEITALHLAASWGHKAVVELLLENEAEVNKKGHINIDIDCQVNAKIETGAATETDVETMTDGEPVADVETETDVKNETDVKFKADLSVRGETTALHLAALLEHEAVVWLLLENEATDINTKSHANIDIKCQGGVKVTSKLMVDADVTFKADLK